MTNTNTTKRPRRMAREPKADASSTPKTDVVTPEQMPAPAPTKAPSKTDAVLSLLKRADGATLDELVAATGWLPHTTRAAMTGLKKKGHQIQRTKADGVSRYTVAGAGAK